MRARYERMRGGFTLLEVLLAAIILGLGLAGILVSMTQAQKMMLSSSTLETAQEVMDMGEMAFRVQTVGVAMVVAECLHASQRIKLQPVIISVISYQGKTGQENCIGRQSVFHAYVCD